MLTYIKDWFHKRFSDPNVVALTLLLIFSFILITYLGHMLAPIFVAIALAYLLDWPVSALKRIGVNHLTAVVLVFLIFVTLIILLVVILIPVVWQQGATLLRELPQITQTWQGFIEQLEDYAPSFIDPSQAIEFTQRINAKLITFGHSLLDKSLNSLLIAATLMVYMIIVPLMVFFMLKDKSILVGHFKRALPEQRRLIQQVATEMNTQIMNYIRGKSLEILIVGGVTFVVFSMFQLKYSALLAVLVGFSVLIPYIGAAVATVPIALVGLFQFGMGSTFVWVLVAYAIIQALDGNVLVPLLFSEAVSLHPVYIIVAVLVFGSLWGFWGVFFAIPLASLVKAVITAFSSQQHAS